MACRMGLSALRCTLGGAYRRPQTVPSRRVGASLDGGGGTGGQGRMETYNVYMDESPAGSEMDGEEGFEVEFRVVANSSDDGDPENSAVLAGLDLVDLINLRDALQQEIDNYALTALEAEAGVDGDGDEGEELMP